MKQCLRKQGSTNSYLHQSAKAMDGASVNPSLSTSIGRMLVRLTKGRTVVLVVLSAVARLFMGIQWHLQHRSSNTTWEGTLLLVCCVIRRSQLRHPSHTTYLVGILKLDQGEAFRSFEVPSHLRIDMPCTRLDGQIRSADCSLFRFASGMCGEW